MKAKLLLALTLIITSIGARANDGPGNGADDARKSDIAGGVYNQDTKKPLNNVSVTAYSANKKEKVVYTDAQGNFSFEELKPGTYKFVFEKEGYKKVTREKAILKIDEGMQVNISMEEHNAFDFIQAPSNFFDF